MTRLLFLLATLLLATAEAPPPPQLDKLERADGAMMVPDHFLRAWDPVTVFLDHDAGPAAGGPEDAPAKMVTMTPPQPGAWTWLDARTLQFRPAEPWTPLRRVSVTLSGRTTTLVPLLPTPVSTAPADDPGGIADLDTFALTFATPVDTASLARLLTIELRPLPGVSDLGAQPLTAQDFEVRPVDRAARTEKQTYLVVLHRPIPDGRLAILRLRLSDEPGLDDPTFELRLRSSAPFTLSDFACSDGFDHDIKDGVMHCTPNDGVVASPRGLQLQFSGPPEAMDIVRGRQVLRFTPPVDDLTTKVDGTKLVVTGRFQADTLYALSLDPGLNDTRKRMLEGESGPHRFAFAPSTPALRWDAATGVVERFGPQMLPLRGHGYDRADLRIHPIDPLSRDFWPFPPGIITQDDKAPPLPGNEPEHWTDASLIGAADIAARIGALGSPSVSELVNLPIQRGGVDAKFGLDVAPYLSRIAGAGQPGAYLVGLRPVDGPSRIWLRVQVTDLSLTALEEADRVRFAITSLATAKPIEGAEVRLEGQKGDGFLTIAHGVTAADGTWVWSPRALGVDDEKPALRRVVATKGADVLVLEPGQNAPPRYAGGVWTAKPRGNWLNWAASGALGDRREKPRLLCHVYTERPIYRPEEKVLIAGMVRRYLRGGLSFASGKGVVTITGPDDQEFTVPATLDDAGGLHVSFDQKTEATGDYKLHFTPDGGDACGEMTFKKEAYRLPTFEVLLNGPQKAPLDAPFSVGLIARWFAGGLLSDRPITWRVMQFPYVWTPPDRPGFLFSSDSRFSSDTQFRSTPVLNRNGTTDTGGSAQLTLDPTIEPTAQPREYVVEATVTGNDDIQVRSTQHVIALPPFVLGIKQPRYLEHSGAIDPEIIATDADGKPLAGLDLTVRVVKRNWNSVLQASDFAQGSAKYQTEVLDETVEERHVTSGGDAMSLHFDAHDAGVYLVEAEATDKIGRRQSVKVDLFMAGDSPVTWSRPPAQTLTVTSDKDAYAPGESAQLVLQSPFQNARALAVVEEPEGPFRTEWVDIADGFGRYAVPIRKLQMPKLSVHFLLMRGRLPNSTPNPTAPFDQGKPTTIAATKAITVTPIDNQMKVSFDAPATARPAQEIDVVLHLADGHGQPVAGEATFWMVDQAVLSLAKERPLDPLPAFIVDRPARMVARDSRNMAFGIIPLMETPGGDEGGDFGMENISVRRNFTPVPIYLPRVKFGPDGIARMHMKLPDTLTVYMLRAKAISGPDRFGFGTGQMRIRQPIVAQPALPRFVRPGDSFDAGVIARVVEGPGGNGRAAFGGDGVQVAGAKEQAFAWTETRPARVNFALTVPQPPPGQDTAHLRFLIQRDADRASDALQIDLPIRPDRPPVRQHQVSTLAPGGTLDLPDAGPVRPNSFSRDITLAADPVLVQLVGGLNALVAYPFGCTEQRMALASAELALSSYVPILDAAGLKDRVANDVAGVVQAIRLNTDDNGLVGFWPHTAGTVSLTAAAYGFLARAKTAGQPVDQAMMDRMGKVLEQALRSDYPHFLSGEDLRERVAALTALAQGGALKADYVAELSRRANAMPTESLAQAATAVAALPTKDPELLGEMMDTLWGRIRILARNGQPVYAGLSDERANPFVLPSETRTLSDVLRAVATVSPDEPRLPVLRSGLVSLGDGDGWGSTNATSAALRALAAAWAPGTRSEPVTITLPDHPVSGSIDADNPVIEARTVQEGPARIQNRGDIALAVLVDSAFTPAAPGAQAQPVQSGFVLSRTYYRVATGAAASAPMEKLEPGADGVLHLAPGDVVEEADEVVNPERRTQVAIRLPLAAGMEPLNPNIATAPTEAAPSAGPTILPSYASYGDDEVLFVYLEMPKGTTTLRFRMRAQVSGSFTAPAATAETMYRAGVSGATGGLRIAIR
jgi:uncharacterized protein YfaS (alpha-2-macroglobulin family)